MNEGEKRVVSNMIKIYCNANHNTGSELCADCTTLDDYAMSRLEKCPFGNNKPTCSICSIHCYKKDMRLQIRDVMRFSGPRMLFRHPVVTIQHFIREYKRKRLYPVTERKQSKR